MICYADQRYKILGSEKDQNSLSWEDRYKVALGVAEALDHLHNAADGPIIHRDVKSSNILLSDDFVPQVIYSSSVGCYIALNN